MGLALIIVLDLLIEPFEIPLVCFSVKLHIPVSDVVDVIQTKADVLELVIEDVGVQRAAQYRHSVRDIMACLVEEDELSQIFVSAPP